jgi:hypothetical protein
VLDLDTLVLMLVLDLDMLDLDTLVLMLVLDMLDLDMLVLMLDPARTSGASLSMTQ